MQESLRTVKYSVQDDVKFEKIALKLGRPKRQVFSQMIDYFYRSKKDPLDFNDELLKNTILKGQKEYIGFIKTQEKELLIPIKRDAARTIEVLKKIVNCFNGQVLKANDELIKNQLAQTKKLSDLGGVIGNIERKAETRQILKERFLYILNSYISQRESLSFMASSKDKEEIANMARKQVTLL
ncbi:BfmA/BtgA family mobilization protein [Pedobacter sp. KBW01]|uniref:BfmA/BtgA family mobilization protein n=1 Tax=Pedobacter sp. KBW01 TaxID=2153364 RepID=UPI000F5972A9|nr:BfmA/BtgA family mobilization protein [Pedobacter sp. KBW01]